MYLNPYFLKPGVLFLTLGVGKSYYSAHYLGYLPLITYLDYDHALRLLLRLLLRCLKHSTFDLTMWPGECPVIVIIEHLKKPRSIYLKDRCDTAFLDIDLLYTRHLDQNCVQLYKFGIMKLLICYIIM